MLIIKYLQKLKILKSLLVASAFPAETLKPYLLTMHSILFGDTFYQRNLNIGKAYGFPAFRADKMWMAADLAASAAKLEVPRSSLDKSLVNNSFFNKTLKRPVNADLVYFFVKSPVDLLLGQRSLSVKQNMHYRNPILCQVKP